MATLHNWFTGDDEPDRYEPDEKPPPRPPGCGPFDLHPQSFTARVIAEIRAHDARKRNGGDER